MLYLLFNPINSAKSNLVKFLINSFNINLNLSLTHTVSSCLFELISKVGNKTNIIIFPSTSISQIISINFLFILFKHSTKFSFVCLVYWIIFFISVKDNVIILVFLSRNFAHKAINKSYSTALNFVKYNLFI